MNFYWFREVENIYRITEFILGIGLLIGSLEDLKTFSVFKDNGLLNWNISRLLVNWTCKGFFSKFLNLILNESSFKTSIYLRVIFSLVLITFSIFNVFSPFIICSLFFLNLIIMIRTPYSLDGSYQMNLMVLLALSIGSFFGIHSEIAKICLYFISAQLISCYFISGIVKISSPAWRKSYAMYGIFSTKIYGHELVYQMISKYSYLCFISCWSILLFETFFWTSLFFSPIVGFGFLIFGALFHLANAAFMGLNNFFFAFLSTYPSFIYLTVILNQR